MRTILIGAVVACAAVPPAFADVSVHTLASLSIANSHPEGNLIVDADGNLFGTTTLGGAYGNGTLFQLPAGSGTVNVVASFGGTAGSNPTFITLDPGGNIYGITSISNGGTIFKVAKNSSAVETVATFNGSNGSLPIGNLVFDAAGNLYGTTATGGANNLGTVFKLPNGSSTISTVASFAGTNGSRPNSIVLDAAGNIYGTTNDGGHPTDTTAFSGSGTIFKIPAGTGTVQTLFSFSGHEDGDGPGSLILDTHGNLYGRTTQGGTGYNGTVFELPAGSSTPVTLANFNVANGAFPQGLVLDRFGDLIGTTSYGGRPGDIYAPGTLFEIPSGTHDLVTMTFDGVTQGARPFIYLAYDGRNTVFGATTVDGPGGNGEIFQILVPEPTMAFVLTLPLFMRPRGTTTRTT